MRVLEEKYRLYTMQQLLHKYFKLNDERSLVTKNFAAVIQRWLVLLPSSV